MIPISIHTQPDDVSCGPTSLHAVYRYYGVDIALPDMMLSINKSLSGGTLTPMLGVHAQKLGFRTSIYVYNIDVFDPTWFHLGETDSLYLSDKLLKQMAFKKDPFITHKSQAYLDYLEHGGRVLFKVLHPDLLKKYFQRNIPIITALSSTYLYNAPREYFTADDKSVYDDIKGTPCGHFVVLCGYDETKRHVIVADPHEENPFTHDNYYPVSITRLINALLLGVLTYDANFLIIEPKEN